MSSLTESEKLDEVEFKWGKKRSIGGRRKDVQFYDSFTYDGVDYTLYDCVYMHKAGEPAPYIAKLVKIWENADKSKRIKVQWLFRPSEISYYLRDVTYSENELFFASGDGIGLANLNPLEAIAGKCNVICISIDNRNPQPSAEEIQMADYVFYRIFDVKSLTISDQMSDKVGGLDVSNVFNRRGVLTLSDDKLDSNDKDEERNVAFKETRKLAGKNLTQQLNNVKLDRNSNLMLEEDKNEMPAQGRLLGKYSSDVDVISNKIRVTTGNTTQKRGILGVENVGDDLSGEKIESKPIKLPVNDVRVEEGVKSARKACNLDDAPSKRLKVEDTSDVQNLSVLENNAAHLVTGAAASTNGKPISELKDSVRCGKDVKLADNSRSLDDKLSTTKSSFSKQAPISGHNKDAIGLQKESKLNKDVNGLQGKLSKSESAHAKDSVCAVKDKKLGGNLIDCGGRPSTSNVVSCGETPRPSTTNASPKETPNLGSCKDFEGSRQAAKIGLSSTTMKRPLNRSADLTKEKSSLGLEKPYENKDKKRASNSFSMEEGLSLKKAKFDDAIKRLEVNNDNTIRKLKEKNCVGEIKYSPNFVTPCINKPKSKFGEAALKVYSNEKNDKLSSDNLPNPLISRWKGVENVGGQVIEVTRRPIEKSKWIKFSWEEKMKIAHDEGRLVLLRNLDPQYTSGEVEDIIWHVFQEMCTARMVQQTAISNPHSGQALVVCRSKDAAYRVLQKLDDGCLILPNQRPLVGCLGVLPKLSGKQTAFVGHLAIDKTRHQMQRKEVVSTSHYSQNNTIEYEMAMDWCLLQSKSNKWWEMLYQQQKRELKKHTDDLKRK